MIIRPATDDDIEAIHELAIKIWWPTYRDIISDEQISFMLQKMYSIEALKQQVNEGINFLIAERDHNSIGFAGYGVENDILKIHKIYILPSEQGKGTGKKLIQYIIALSKTKGCKILELNVNRNNPALNFYKKLGFEVDKEVDIPYYEFVLNDYVLRISL